MIYVYYDIDDYDPIYGIEKFEEEEDALKFIHKKIKENPNCDLKMAFTVIEGHEKSLYEKTRVAYFSFDKE
ncbi:MAG: hypothetical protein ACYTBJ_22140 [Planctomycetota bacterium]|jgi:hypothetical protein